MHEAVRQATASDLTRMAELARAGIWELSPMKGGRVWAAREARAEPLEESLAEALADPASWVVVGTLDEVVVGYSVARVERLRDGTALGVIDDIFVEEQARAIGVGEAMMAELVRWCRQQGCIGIDAMALPGHRASKNFFEESGFSARKIVMHHRLLNG